MNMLKSKKEIERLPFQAVAVIFSAILAIMLIVSAVFITKRARSNFEKTTHKELAQFCKNMKLQFERGLDEQIALAMQMAKSPVIIKHFEDPSDDKYQDEAFDEVEAYQDSFLSKLSFLICDKDLRYYSNSKYLYTLDKEDPSSAWYIHAMNSKKAYEFDVDYDIGLKQTFMWVNGIVRNQKGKFLGLIGTGIPISQFVDSLYLDLPEDYSMYIFNSSLETTGSTDLQHLENKVPITDVIVDFKGREEELKALKETFIDDENTVYSLKPLEEIGWTIVVSKNYTVSAFIEGALVPASVCLVILVFIFLIFFIFFRIHLLQSNEKNIGNSILEEMEKLADSSKDTAATAQDQSAAVKEIVATMEDNTSLSESISKKIKDVSGVASKTCEDVSDGVSYLESNVKQLHEIADANNSTIDGIRALGEKIENIWDIVSLINSVADQAKIIAFNAELEASSAGDAGKNFHIVASEIRRLADGIIDGTKEIKARINEIQQSSDSLILASESGTEKINEGVDKARTLEERFASIKNASEMTASSAGDITTIIQQQAEASEQILITLRQIAFGVDKFKGATESISKTSQKLKDIAENLSKGGV